MECATMPRTCLKPPSLQDVKLQQSRLRPDVELFDFGAARWKLLRFWKSWRTFFYGDRMNDWCLLWMIYLADSNLEAKLFKVCRDAPPTIHPSGFFEVAFHFQTQVLCHPRKICLRSSCDEGTKKQKHAMCSLKISWIVWLSNLFFLLPALLLCLCSCPELWGSSFGILLIASLSSNMSMQHKPWFKGSLPIWKEVYGPNYD